VRLFRAVLVVVDLVSLVSLLTGPGPVADNLRALALALAFLAAVVILFLAGCFAVALLDQRRPPYPTGTPPTGDRPPPR
jgi:hypothetical protein